MSTLPQSPPPPQEGQPQPGPPPAPARFVPPARQRWTGERVHLLRTAHGLSRSDLGQLAGVSDSTVGEWERGGRLQRGVMHRILDYVAASQAGGDVTSEGVAA